MNKTHLIIAGTSVVSLAAGAAGGYFLAKRRFDEQLLLGIAVETEKTKKYYALQAMQTAKPSLEDLVAGNETDELTEQELDDALPNDELTPEDEAVITKGRANLAQASKAMTNYQGYSDKPPLDQVVEKSNIFDGKKARLPAKDPATGRFLPTKIVGENQPDEPHLITADEFLLNDSGYDQDSLLYFIKDDTLIVVADNEEVDTGKIGAANLTLFPEEENGMTSQIYVRNDGLAVDYQITRTYESLTVHMGLGEDEADLPDEDDDDADVAGNFAERR